MDEEVYRLISQNELYARTGIQKQMFNTIYQLMAIKKKKPQELEKAKTFLMVPDYFHYLFTGIKANEYTEGTTAQLMSPVTKEIAEEIGYDVKVVLPATHQIWAEHKLSKSAIVFAKIACVIARKIIQ